MSTPALIGDLIDPSAWSESEKLTMDNYHIWSHKVGLMLRHHQLNKYIRIKGAAVECLEPLTTEDLENLSLASSYIQQTMTQPLLVKFVNGDAEVIHNSRKLWKKLADSQELIPKGKAAFVRFHLQLGNLRLRDFKDPAEFVEKLAEVQSMRKATGVKLTDDLENIVALVRHLPRELEEVGLKWRLSDYEGLTAAEALMQIKAAQEAYDKLPKVEQPREPRRPEIRRGYGRTRGGERRGFDRKLDGRRGGRDRR
ncbi:hypothetical protein ONS95_008989 [Cadophora gregata]|uniref:uncharacterized protein n=1 Tax=Cadophora gregata TaxID=51156 RepID=UPI0026DB651E|nr:uncharacterized protein ONS95_008989 [Cadophora gregata]KAK0124000.1 hypothetical protein ONS95_008989 [Cadophora gregata]KAK0130338.1 hypothetical protein ONS96_000860 [Cadophora gregata f. sp. sojae]